ncbi:MAG: TraR/DksA family transcriptional regulator [Myxococcota bacterium]
MQDLKGIQERLTHMREEIAARTGAVERDLRRKRNPDSEERATETENDMVLERLDEGGREELARIDAALARIEQGRYGTCDQCGDEIAIGRLEALPFATDCVDCASDAG